jgi:hypothetical protein
MRDEIPDSEHPEILNNSEADILGRILTFTEYLKLNYNADKALSMAGLKESDIHNNPILRLYYMTAMRQCDPNDKHMDTDKSTHETEKFELDQMWDGYCPESLLRGKKIRMKLNRSDFYESEETGLQISVKPGIQAVIMNFRGKGNFRIEPEFADEIENGELLSPQNTDKPPFNNPTVIFEKSEEIEAYIRSIKK